MKTDSMQADKKWKKLVLGISIGLFVLSLTQKCYCTTSNCGDSIMVLLLGWFSIFSSAAGIAWYANPLLLAAWIFLSRNLKLSFKLSLFSFFLALSFLLFDSIVANENGNAQQIISYKPGYWLWIASHFVMFAGTTLLVRRSKTQF